MCKRYITYIYIDSISFKIISYSKKESTPSFDKHKLCISYNEISMMLGLKKVKWAINMAMKAEEPENDPPSHTSCYLY